MRNGLYKEDGIDLWYYNDQLHREDGPACTESDGSTSWYVKGELHRLEGPAVSWADGTLEWWVHGRRSRLDGPAIVYGSGGLRAWFVEGERHRVGGPAVEAESGARAWYQHGLLHREDGPAVEGADGTTEWHLDGVKIKEEDFALRHFDPKKVLQVRSAYAKPTRVVESTILAMRKKYLEDQLSCRESLIGNGSNSGASRIHMKANRHPDLDASLFMCGGRHLAHCLSWIICC
jgi:hypothetical protein